MYIIYLNVYISYRLIAKFFKLNNWLLLGVSLVPILIGVILIGDWQAIGHDPCLQDWNSNSNKQSGDLFLSTENYSNSSLFQGSCESWSNSTHQCFWNPQSRITRECCNTCHDACLSKQKSMDIYQLSIGVLLISVMFPIGFFSIPAILSDISSVESQVCLHLYTPFTLICSPKNHLFICRAGPRFCSLVVFPYPVF